MSPSSERRTLVVAGTSVRAMAESARRGGWDVVALDLFGDVDTVRASHRWFSIGDPVDLRIDDARLASALREAAGDPGAIGWVAGSGFEGDPAWLEAGGSHLPLLGMRPSAVAAVRDARHFFATLDRLGLAHPPVAFSPPWGAGWLVKRQGGSGGWHIRPADPGGHLSSDEYCQRLQPGEPMSALFLADGRQARVVGLNRLAVQPLHGHPMVYHGAVGPVRDEGLLARVASALDRLVPAFDLRGLASLDFIAAPGGPWLLEVNPRPSATLQLHDDTVDGGLMRAHVDAQAGALPSRILPAGTVRGHRIVHATGACRIDATLLAELAEDPHCHDVPSAPGRFEAGQPICSVSAEAGDAASVERLLLQREDRLRGRLEEEAASSRRLAESLP